MIRAIKICCIQSEMEAALAVSAGADLLGLVSAMPSGPGPIDEASIARIVATIPQGVDRVLLTSRRTASEITAQQRRTGANVLQLVDTVPDDELRRLRDTLPGVALMQVIHVTGPGAVDEALRVAPLVDRILLDSGNPSAPVPELGGTGRTHDWAHSRAICASVPLPVFLAGGLHAANVRAAIDSVRPYGVDVCSGVRTAGRLDPFKLRAFIDAARTVHEGDAPPASPGRDQ